MVLRDLKMADFARFKTTWEGGYRGPEEQEEAPPPPPTPPTPPPTPPTPPTPPKEAARKRKAEAARERRKRARPSPASVAEIIARLCERCTVEEASSVEAVRAALKAAGCNQNDIKAHGLDTSNRRQRGSSEGRFYYFVHRFSEQSDSLEPVKLR